MTQAERLKELRKSHGLSLRDLEKETGISRTSLSRLENGERTGTIEALTSLANFYKVSLDYLTCNPGATYLVDDIIQTFIDKKIIVPGEPISQDIRDTVMNILEEALKAKRNQS